MDASGVGLEAVFYAVAGAVVGVFLAGLVIAVVASLLGGRGFGPVSLILGLVVAVVTVVDVVVIWRIVGREVTGWDLLWAAGLTVAGVWSMRRLASP